MALRSVIAVLSGVVALAAAPASFASTTTHVDGLTVQVTPPQGDHLGQPTRGAVLVIHGGGWQATGPQTLADMDRYVGWVTRAGWTAVSVDYRPHLQSLVDTQHLYWWTRHRYGHRPVCTLGESAGAHLALMVAVRYPSVACVVGLGAATWLPAVESENHDLWNQMTWTTFPTATLAQYSPVTYARQLERTPILLGTSAADRVLPAAQLRRFLKADPRAHGMVLRAGQAPFTHAPVDRGDRELFRHRVVRLLHSVE